MIDYKEHIKELFTSLVGGKKIEVSKPPKEEMGNFSVPVFGLLEGNPVENAKSIAEKLEIDSNYIDEISVMGPYINFKVNKEYFNKEVLKSILNKEKYGSMNQGDGEKLLIEHTSINPNASPHMGRARNTLIGDFLSRLYKFVGYDVERHYLVNDIGKQISMLLVGVKKYGNLESLTFSDMLDLYIKINEESEKDEAIVKEAFDYLNRLESGDEEIREEFKKITDICVKGQTDIFKKMNVEFDVFTHESDFVYGDILKDILSKIDAAGRLKEDEFGRLYVDLSGYDIPTKTPVLILTREDKTSLYPLRDIAYTKYKMDLNDKNNFIVLGEDQIVYMKQISAVMDIIGYKSPKLTSYSFILLNGGKMATRKGNVVLLEDFLEETKEALRESFNERGEKVSDEILLDLASSSIKYAMLKVSKDKNVNFSLDDAIDFQGDTAIYVLYNLARINSILSKYEGDLDYSNLKFSNDMESSLIGDLYDFPYIIDNLLVSNESVQLVNYIYNVVQKFSKYYNMVNILNEKDESLKISRIILLRSIKLVLENGLNILGITPIKKI